MPAKKVIILNRPNPGQYRFILWADVPAARQLFYADSTKTSAWINASNADITALRNGSVVEREDIVNVGIGKTVQDIQALLQSTWQDFQNEISATGLLNPYQRYGTFWDGATWIAGSIA